MSSENGFARILASRASQITDEWLQQQAQSQKRMSAVDQKETDRKSRQFMEALKVAAESDPGANTDGPQWAPVREMLAEISASRAKSGYSPSETATFIFSLKHPIFSALRAELGSDADALSGACGRPRSCWTSSGCSPRRRFRRRAKKSSPASSRNCWNFPLPWCGSGKTCWRCR